MFSIDKKIEFYQICGSLHALCYNRIDKKVEFYRKEET